jgi:hypothetical protein
LGHLQSTPSGKISQPDPGTASEAASRERQENAPNPRPRHLSTSLDQRSRPTKKQVASHFRRRRGR